MKAKTISARLAVAMLLISACAACRSQEPQSESANLSNDTATLPSLPVVERPIDRAKLLFAVARAASAHSAGANDLAEQRQLDGKQFEVRIRFGCDGQGASAGDHGWSVDHDGRTLRLRVVPTMSLGDDLIRGLAGSEVEAAEGFWLARPWMMKAGCAAGQFSPERNAENQADRGKPGKPPTDSSEAVQPIVQRVGITEFFTAEDSRTHRRMNRPFEAVRTLAPGELIGQQGFDLALAGRLRARPGGRVILCTGSGRLRPPDCIVSVDVDRVRIERPDDGVIIAEWTV